MKAIFGLDAHELTNGYTALDSVLKNDLREMLVAEADMDKKITILSNCTVIPILKRSIEIIGTDRTLFFSDYPYTHRPAREARNFLEAIDLTQADKGKFAFKNWERLNFKS